MLVGHRHGNGDYRSGREEGAVRAVRERGDGALAGRGIVATLALLVLPCRHLWVHKIFGIGQQASDKMSRYGGKHVLVLCYSATSAPQAD